MSHSTGHSDATDESAADWADFESRLESRITAIEPEGSLAVNLSDVAGDFAPYVQIVKSPDGGELYSELSSNEFLNESFAMTPDVVSSLLQLGWFPPVSGGTAVDRPNFFAHTKVGSEADLASIITESFRQAFPELGPNVLEQAIEGDHLPAEGTPDWADRQGAPEAWAEFGANFIARLLNVSAPASIEMRVDQALGDSSPTITAYTVSEGREALVEVSSNKFLPPHARLSPTQIGTLLNLGWNPPSAPNDDLQIPGFHVVAPTDRLETLSTFVVETLQAVFGIPHPAFLEPAPREDQLHGSIALEDPHEGEARLPIDQAYVPEDLDDLRWAVSHVIRNTHDVYVAPDGDGTFALRRGNAGLLIGVRDNGAISIISFVVTSMSYPDRAAETLERLNDNALYARFYVDDDSLVASCDFPAMPFVPAHLIEVMVTMTNVVDEVASDLASITGGTLLFSAAEADDASTSDDDELPEELLALIHMDNEPEVEVSPELAARVFQRNRSLILDCIRQCEEQAISWAESAESEEDDETAEVCRGEATAWEDMASLLRRSLAFTIE